MSGDVRLEERTIGYALRLVLPEPPIPNKGFKECCYENIVFASTISSKDYENDYNGFYHKRQLASETCDFILVDQNNTEYSLNDDTYGTYVDFNNGIQNDLSWYVLNWKNVLTLIGEGSYFIRKDVTILGSTYEIPSNTYILKQFSDEAADTTVRIDCIQNGYLEHIDIDFKGTNFKDTLRTKGFFGRREPDFIQENDVYRNENVVQNNMWQDNEYQYQIGIIPDCITEILFDFILFGNELFMNDYNLNNHSYNFRKKAVVLKSNKGTKYFVFNRNAQINLAFEDRVKNKRKINN